MDINRIIEFTKKEFVLIIAVILAVITSFFSKPQLGYINIRVLILLFNLIIIVSALKEIKLLDYIAMIFLNKCKTLRKVTFILVAITFIASMFLTNDVALLTFVPLTIIIGQIANISVINIIIYQTLAANLGSSLTPMGNPQNLYLYSFYKLPIGEFFSITYIIFIVSIIFLLGIILKDKNKKVNFELKTVTIKSFWRIRIFPVVFIFILLSVFDIIDYRTAFLFTVTSVGVFDPKQFKKIDYSLLLTFIAFFIFVGNIVNIQWFKEVMTYLMDGEMKTYIMSILTSQLISNVPASILLSQFTDNYTQLILGINIGGMGTIVASLASLISYKLFVAHYKGQGKEFLKKFTLYNILGIILFTVVIYILF